MNKRTFITFGAVAILLAVLIPLWAFSKDGSESSSPLKVDEGDEHARELFAENCGSCHALARAGTDGVVGPNLDDRLAGGSIEAPTEDAIAGTQARVLNAIENGFGDGAMPAGILQASNAEEVAHFVAKYAGQ